MQSSPVAPARAWRDPYASQPAPATAGGEQRGQHQHPAHRLAHPHLALGVAAQPVPGTGRAQGHGTVDRIRALSETVRLDLSRPVSPGDNSALLALSAAAHGWQRVHLNYRSAQGEDSERDFDPYGLAWRDGRWYVVGMCHLRHDLRSFRLDRVLQVQPVNAVFKPPADFDAVRHLALGIATMPRAIRIQVLLRTSLETAQAELFEGIGLFQPCEDGVLLHSQTDNLDWFARQLARLSFDFEIRQPPELREALRACAERLRGLVS